MYGFLYGDASTALLMMVEIMFTLSATSLADEEISVALVSTCSNLAPAVIPNLSVMSYFRLA